MLKHSTLRLASLDDIINLPKRLKCPRDVAKLEVWQEEDWQWLDEDDVQTHVALWYSLTALSYVKAELFGSFARSFVPVLLSFASLQKLRVNHGIWTQLCELYATPKKRKRGMPSLPHVTKFMCFAEFSYYGPSTHPRTLRTITELLPNVERIKFNHVTLTMTDMRDLVTHADQLTTLKVLEVQIDADAMKFVPDLAALANMRKLTVKGNIPCLFLVSLIDRLKERTRMKLIIDCGGECTDSDLQKLSDTGMANLYVKACGQLILSPQAGKVL